VSGGHITHRNTRLRDREANPRPKVDYASPRRSHSEYRIEERSRVYETDEGEPIARRPERSVSPSRACEAKGLGSRAKRERLLRLGRRSRVCEARELFVLRAEVTTAQSPRTFNFARFSDPTLSGTPRLCSEPAFGVVFYLSAL